ncbi:MAG: cation:proton antiporter [candidate division Zixibacteria bacterium]|nr:cation:proton antiporter [candidate division Zixibacteria bacterium]
MTELFYLRDLVVILGLGIIIVVATHRFKLPAIAGFIVAGILAGPKGFGLVNDISHVETLAEIGVALLLFGIGTELSLDRLKRLWKPVLIGGIIQVGLSIAIVYVVARLLGLASGLALFVGFVAAISSTAIVLRDLQQRGEIDAPHGRLTLGILVFQDLCVVPMILMVPLLCDSSSLSSDPVSILIRSAVIIVVTLLAARLIIPRLMNLIARVRQRNIFIMTVLLISVGMAWILTSAGVSLALGAFLAGLIVAGSEYRHQALADIIPFREVFASLFFASVGMLLDPHYLMESIVLILLLTGGIVVGKFAVVFLTGVLMRLPIRVTTKAAVALAQVGEFAFVLIGTAVSYKLIDSSLASNLMAATILSMLVTPFLINAAPRIAAGVGGIRILTRLLDVSTAQDAAEIIQELRGHVVIGGYGLAGADLALALRDGNIPYVVADLNPENVRRARHGGQPAYFGDITSSEVLERLGVPHAKEFVIIINDAAAIERAVKAARYIAPELRITVRTRYLLDADALFAAGATDVVVAEVEASAEVVARVLQKYPTDPDLIRTHVARIRNREKEVSE